MKKGFSLIELLVTITIFSIVLSIVIFFYIQSQRHIIKEQEKGYVDDMAVVNLNKIRDKILKAERIIAIEKKMIKLQMRTGELDSIFETGNGVVSGEKRLCSDAKDIIVFFWQDPASSDEFVKDMFDNDGNGILEENEIMNLKIIYIKYKIIKNKNSSELNTSIYLRK